MEEKISFEFEEEVFEEEEEQSTVNPSLLPTNSPFKRPKQYKQIVCWKWLENLCTNDDATCNFLHRYDESRLPICRYFVRYGECLNRPHCIYKHTNQEVKECIMYNFGFCPNGPNCRYKHKKVPGPPPPVEEVFEIIKRQSGSENNSKYPQISTPRSNYVAPRLLKGISRYFIVRSNNLDNLHLSVERELWATLPKNESILNEAFDSCDNVVLIFSVNQAPHFHGCAKMASKIGVLSNEATWNDGHGHLKKFGNNFGVKWLKRCVLPFQKTGHLKNPYNQNLPVQISRDCQELERSVGEELASLLFLEKDVNSWPKPYDNRPMPKRRKLNRRSDAKGLHNFR